MREASMGRRDLQMPWRRLRAHRSAGSTLFKALWVAALLAWMVGAPWALAQDAEKGPFEGLLSKSLAELGEVVVEVASPGSPGPLSQAPAVASVITSEQIRAMGATHLDDILESVPGLHIAPSQVKPLDPVYSIRGIHSQVNNQVLTLLDGLPVVQQLTGGPLFVFRMPVANIERIEVIRGPGSAVYGADAFAGVVNIVTKKASDIDSSEVGVRLGSFDTFNAWGLHSTQIKGWDVAMGFEWQQSSGDEDRIIGADLQTTFDGIFGTSASLAPGSLNTGFEVLDMHLTLERKDWTVRLWGWLEDDKEVGAGSGQALDPEGKIDSTHVLVDVAHRKKLSDRWELGNRLSFLYLDQRQDGNLRLFPRGTVLPIGSDGNVNFFQPVGVVAFPDGFIGNPSDFSRSLSWDSFAIYDAGDKHRWRVGVGVNTRWMDTAETLNFGPGVIDGTQPVVDGTLTDITDSPFIFVGDHDRDLWYVSVQDHWQVSPRLEITAGLRFDHYSDFDSTVNPRLALVYKPSPDRDPSSPGLTTKLLYGTAFRAPSFVELFLSNNPVQLGNANLKPETIETLELVFDYSPNQKVRTALSFFGHEIEDLIDLVPDFNGSPSSTYQNAKEQEGYGFEVETAWQVSGDLQLLGNFAWQRAQDGVTGERVPFAAGQQAFLSLHWGFLESWTLNGRVNWVAGREREAGDPRPQLDDYTMTDLTLRHQPATKNWEWALGLRNVLDEDALEPSSGEVPGDYPLAGRSAFLELRRRF